MQAVEDDVAGTLVLTGDALKKEAQVAVEEADDAGDDDEDDNDY